MRPKQGTMRRVGAARAAGLGLVLFAAVSCADGDDDAPPPAAGAPSDPAKAAHALGVLEAIEGQRTDTFTKLLAMLRRVAAK